MITKVLPDANVLYSKTLRDWLFLIRNEVSNGMYTVQSTEDILAEVTYNFRRNNQTIDGGKVARLVSHLRDSVDGLIPESQDDPNYSGTDQNDRHVHAAALAGEGVTVLTFDGGLLRLDDDRYEVCTPDDFFCLADDSYPFVVRAVALKQHKYWRSRTPKGKSLPDALKLAGCPEFADRVRLRLGEGLRRPALQTEPQRLSVS